MNVVIQNPKDKTFLQKDGAWGPNSDEAMVFSNSIAALNYCLLHRLENAQIILRFGSPQHDVILPLRKS